MGGRVPRRFGISDSLSSTLISGWEFNTMPAPRISARAFILRDDRLLLAKYEDHRGNWYTFPGGGQNNGETLAECLKREVWEEMGLEVVVGPMRFVREIIADRHPETALQSGFHQVEVVFDCALSDGAEPVPGSNCDPNQIGWEWVPVSRLGDILFFPESLGAEVAGPAIVGTYLGEIR
jgi:8-oxo-dGTP pyrophosphatase MutT (NUDIX family)